MRFDAVPPTPVGVAPRSNGPLVALIVVGVLLALSCVMVLAVMSWLKSATSTPAPTPTTSVAPLSKKTSRPAQQGR